MSRCITIATPSGIIEIEVDDVGNIVNHYSNPYDNFTSYFPSFSQEIPEKYIDIMKAFGCGNILNIINDNYGYSS
jgi:hypothetical protein